MEDTVYLVFCGRVDNLDSLQTFYKHVGRKPAFMCVIVGHLETVMRDPATGIFITPITSLRP